MELYLPGCDTLKEKRHRLKGILERTRSKFNVSVSEIESHDLHQSSVVACAMVNTERYLIEQVFARIEDLFANGDGLLVTGTSVEWF